MQLHVPKRGHAPEIFKRRTDITGWQNWLKEEEEPMEAPGVGDLWQHHPRSREIMVGGGDSKEYGGAHAREREAHHHHASAWHIVSA